MICREPNSLSAAHPSSRTSPVCPNSGSNCARKWVCPPRRRIKARKSAVTGGNVDYNVFSQVLPNQVWCTELRRKSSSQSAVEPSECMGQHYRHDEHARPENKHVLGLAQIKVPNAAHEQIANREVEKAPCDIDHCRGQAHSGRRCEGTLEGVPRDSVAKMRQGVGEERAPEKVRQIMIPAHHAPS